MSIKRTAFTLANQALDRLPSPIRQLTLQGIATLPLERMRPRFMAIEPTNACNLKCPLCPVGASTMTRPRGFMDFDLYRSLVDEISSHANQLLMNFAGEPLLHPRIGDMVAHAVGHDLRLTLGTNGNIDKMEEMVEAGLPEILFAIDGTTPETYTRYRVGGDLDSALANLEKLMAARSRAGTGTPRVILQFVVMRHNEAQIPELVEIGRRFGVDEISLQPVCVNDFFETDRADLLETWVPPASQIVLHPGADDDAVLKPPPLCVWPLQSVVLFNGDVTMCCFDADGKHVVGNAFQPGGFKRVWESPEYRTLRKEMILQTPSLCRQCDISLVKPSRFSPADYSPHAEGANA